MREKRRGARYYIVKAYKTMDKGPGGERQGSRGGVRDLGPETKENTEA